jgi:acyl-CoA hydrolase
MSRRSQFGNTPTLRGLARLEKARNMIETARKEFKVALNIYRKNPSQENQELLDQTKKRLFDVYDEYKADVIFSWLDSPEIYKHNLRSKLV